jgi:hypothetical protein
MARMLEHALDLADLDDAAEVHHRDAVRDVTHDREIVRDEQIRDAELRLQILEQADHAGLNRHVERRHRLVEHDELRLHRERACDRDALPLTARELLGEAIRVIGIQADEVHDLADPPVDGVGFPALREERLGEDVVDRHPWIERGERILEDDLQLAADLHALGAARELRDVAA